jgi:EF-P beta-lysylation protein EpmB
MITAAALPAQPPSWKRLLREAFRDLDELLAHLGLTRAEFDLDENPQFPLRVPRGFVARMQHGDPADPLLLQVLPLAAERALVPGYVADPVGDLTQARARGVIHKYAHRVLLVTTGSCAVHCRYCFRRHFPYAQELAATEEWRDAVAQIAGDDSIHEVILSGGDPLSLATHKLKSLTAQLARVPHLRRLRIHTRWPIVLPERVDAELGLWLRGLPWPTVVVVHANHANEIDDSVVAAIGRLRAAGASVLNQTVLLHGINDSVVAQCALSEALLSAGALPYYLHLLDPVAGAAHFDVAEERAREIVAAMRVRLPGFLVPRLAREVPGAPSKSVLM